VLRVYHVIDVNSSYDKNVVNIALWSPNLYILNMPTESEPRCAWGLLVVSINVDDNADSGRSSATRKR
jgi:hypothetical protein